MVVLRACLVLFFPIGVWATQGFDHCKSCRGVDTRNPAPSGLCPNLMATGDLKPFLKPWDEKLSVSSMKSGSPSQQFSKFLVVFKSLTKEFKTSLIGEDSAEIRAIQQRLLSSVGWRQPNTWDEARKVAESDRRISDAARNLVCELNDLRSPKSDCNGDMASLSHEDHTLFMRRLEGAILEHLSEGVTVEEMLRGRVIPGEGARARLLVAMMERRGLSSSLVFALPKGDLIIACENKLPRRLRFTMFSIGKNEESDTVTLVNGTKEGFAALQSFPALGEWISFTTYVQSEPRSPAQERVQLPVCFQNESQARDFACGIWRNQK